MIVQFIKNILDQQNYITWNDTYVAMKPGTQWIY